MERTWPGLPPAGGAGLGPQREMVSCSAPRGAGGLWDGGRREGHAPDLGTVRTDQGKLAERLERPGRQSPVEGGAAKASLPGVERRNWRQGGRTDTLLWGHLERILENRANQGEK